MVHLLNNGRQQVSDSLNGQLRRLSLDELHTRRKRLEEELRDGMFTKDQMNWHDCQDEDQEVRRVAQYERWKNTVWNGKSNEQRMREWSEINREFKRRDAEGRIHSVDDIRAGNRIKYD